MERIASRRNPLVLRFRAAARGDHPALLLDGTHLVRDALAANVPIDSALVRDGDAGPGDGLRLAGELRARNVRVCLASADVMAAASPVRSSSPIVALGAVPALPASAPYHSEAPLVMITCGVQDPGNLGAIVRVAEAAGASGLVAAGDGADPFGWKALRGSMGSALRLPVVRERDVDAALREARSRGCRVVVTIPRAGAPLFESDLAGPVAIVVGGEGAGLDPAVVDGADLRLTIPMTPPVESLNAAVAAALVVYESRRQRGFR